MNILIAYATYSGGTRLAGLVIESVLKTNHQTTLRNVFEIEPDEFKHYDFVILGSNSWLENKEEGQMNSGYHRLKEKVNEKILSGKKVAIYALGDSNLYHNTFCKSAEHLEHLVAEWDGTLVCSPLKVDRFYFDEENNEEKIKNWAEELNQFLMQEQSH